MDQFSDHDSIIVVWNSSGSANNMSYTIVFLNYNIETVELQTDRIEGQTARPMDGVGEGVGEGTTSVI